MDTRTSITVDMTPAAALTPDGAARINAAAQELTDANMACADVLADIDAALGGAALHLRMGLISGGVDPSEATALAVEARQALTRRAAASHAFLAAVAGL